MGTGLIDQYFYDGGEERSWCWKKETKNPFGLSHQRGLQKNDIHRTFIGKEKLRAGDTNRGRINL